MSRIQANVELDGNVRIQVDIVGVDVVLKKRLFVIKLIYLEMFLASNSTLEHKLHVKFVGINQYFCFENIDSNQDENF